MALAGGCDFSRVAIDLTELSPGIDECAGVDGAGQLNFGPLNLGGGTIITGATCVPPSANLVNVDVNSDTAFTALPGWNDWAQLRYRFQDRPNFVDAGASSADGSQLDFRPQDLEAVQAATEAQTAPDLAAVISAPDSAPNGTTVTAILEVENSGLGPAFAVEAVLDDPDGVEISSISPSQLNVGETTPGASGTFTIPVARVPDDPHVCSRGDGIRAGAPRAYGDGRARARGSRHRRPDHHALAQPRHAVDAEPHDADDHGHSGRPGPMRPRP